MTWLTRSVESGALPVVAVLLFVTSAAGAGAQTVSESAGKAAVLYNVAKFTDWPVASLPAGSAMEFCVLDGAVADALQDIVVGRSINEHALRVTRVLNDEPPRTCAVLYIGNRATKQTGELLASERNMSVLSIGDSPRFIEMGGMVRVFVDAGKLKFAVNIEAARRAKLHLSSQLLMLATVVKDGVE